MQRLRKYKFSVVKNAPLTIYEPPERDTRYTIGIDTATGVSFDWTVAQVLSNRIPFEQVAVWRAKIPMAQAGEELVNLCWHYNQGLAVIETTGVGTGMQDAFIETHGYGRCYQKEERLDSEPNVSAKYGWPTTQTSKWLLIREMQQALKDNEVILHDKRTIEELCNYVYIEDKSKTGAAEGLNDDCVIGLMLAFHGAKLYPQKHKKKVPKQKLSGDQLQQRRIMQEMHEQILHRLKHGEPIEVL